MFSGSPGAKESITSRSEVNYPIIDGHSSVWDARRNQKLLRFVTVIAYIFFVSLAAIVLSMYYYFFHVPHMGTSVFPDSRPVDDSLKLPEQPIEPFVARGRKRFQHNVNHFPLEAIASALTTPPPAAKCDEQATRDEESMYTTAAAIAVQFTRHESTAETVARALPLAAPAYTLPTAPSVYELISRRKGSRAPEKPGSR